MSIADKLSRLSTARDNIISSLIGKGVSATGHGFEDFATDIASIQTLANLQSKSATPIESELTITPDSGYDGLSSVIISAISSLYVGSGITRRTSSDLTASGATVTVPAGYYDEQASKAVQSGTMGTPRAVKGTVSNNSIIITPKVTNTAGYIIGGAKTGENISVSASELVSGNKAITENGTNIDVTNYATVSVDVESGGGLVEPAPKKDVNFIDYDGTILYSYTANEFQALSALPDNPTHSGLVAQGWNWTLAQIKAQLTAIPNEDVWVGQMYTTASGMTEIDVHFHDTARLSPILTIAVSGTVSVDWGDNTAASSVTGTSLSTRKAVSHTYAEPGKYTIKIKKVSGSYAFYGSYQYPVLRKNTTENENKVYANCVRSVRIGESVTVKDGAFYNCHSLESVTIPSGVTSIGTNFFTYCYSLTSITIPSGVTSIGNSIFHSCFSLASVTIPSGVTSMGNSVFYNCHSLASITIPSGVTSIGTQEFYNCSGIAEYHFLPTSPPTLPATSVFSGIPSDCKIYVPANSLETYKSASYWSTYASKMVGE